MEKVGLVAVSINNYGSLLQTYAMQKVLDNLNIENDIILFKSDPLKQLYRIVNVPFLTMKLKLCKRVVATRFFFPSIYRGSALRDREFASFKDKYCRFTEKTTSRKELLRIGKKYRAFVLGSDQVWNPANLQMDFYTMNFVPEEKMKIAYAPSFGVSVIPPNQLKRTKEYLKRIQYISVREIAGAQIVKELVDRNVPVVCDPTGLLTREQWDMIKGKKLYLKEKYIFCYFLGSNPQHREFANSIKKVTGYKIIALQHIDEFVKTDLKFGDLKPYSVGPEEFINLLSNAEIVLTDSFHGTMFSIYYHKNFYTFSRYAEGKKDSTNSRIISILEMMNLTERKLNGTENAAECLAKAVNWTKVEEILQEFRKRSFNYLLKALREGKVIL